MKFKALNSLLVLIALSSVVHADETDTRQAINLTSAEKNWLLNDMRGHLSAIATINAALATGDVDAARAMATAHGMAQMSEPGRPPNFRAKTNPKWVSLAVSLHKDFDSVAQGLSEHEPLQQTVGRIGKVMQNCVACHAMHKVVETP